MNKKTVKIIILIIFILSIPISIKAFSSKITEIENTIPLIRKVEYSSEDSEVSIDERVTISDSQIQTLNLADEDTVLEEKIEKAELESQQTEKQLIQIINEYYPNEFLSITKELENKSSNIINSELPEDSAEMKLYKLILNILEIKNPTTDEAKIIKEFKLDQSSNLKAYPELQEKINNICAK